MKAHQSKHKPTPRPLFSCGFFRHCTQTVLSPTTSTPPSLPLPNSNPPPPSPPPPIPSYLSATKVTKPPPPPDSDSSSSSNTSQSFTQWRFPIQNSPTCPYSYPAPETGPAKDLQVDPPPVIKKKTEPPPELPVIAVNFEELFHVAELQLSTGSDCERVRALQMLERSLVCNARAVSDCGDPMVCPAAVMEGVVGFLKDGAEAKTASKVLLALCLVEGNRHVAVEVGAVGAVVESLTDMEGPVAERALAALELLCTLAEGAAEVKAHALAVPMMVEVMGRTEERGKECAISVLAVIYGGPGERVPAAPPEEVARAVVLSLQGGCSARGKRKGAQLLKILQDMELLDLTQEEKSPVRI